MLLVRFEVGDRSIWATPGGGIEYGESPLEALDRELNEETGLCGAEIGPPLWTRRVVMAMGHWDGQEEVVHLVRCKPFEPTPLLSEEQLRAESVHELRWWSVEELLSAGPMTAPRALVELASQVLREGAPAAPIEIGL